MLGRTEPELTRKNTIKIGHPATSDADHSKGVDVNPAAMAADRCRMRQHGTRRLWEEIESAHTWWAQRGRPTFTDFGLTVGPEEQFIWLGDPSHRIDPIGYAGSRARRAG